MESVVRFKSWHFLVLTLVMGCNAVNPYYSKSQRQWTEEHLPETSPIHTVYLIGDAGDLNDDDPISAAMRGQMLTDGKSSLIFLGDNVYHYGLPEEDAFDRKAKEKILHNQMDLADGYAGQTYFIPGNHDWSHAGEDGLATIRRQDRYVDAYFGTNVFRPDNGCPGPVALDLDPSLLLVIIDSQWWLHQYDVARGESDSCSVTSHEDFRDKLLKLVAANDDRNVLLVGHHPVRTNGVHGGHFGFMDHLFPLRNVRSYLYIPLPFIGSLYPLSRMFGVSRQDTPNKFFKTYEALILEAMALNPQLTYASGHEHNLQLFMDPDLRQIISGAGSKLNYVRKGKDAHFIHQHRGFCRVLYYSDGESWVEFYSVDEEGAQLTYRERLN